MIPASGNTLLETVGPRQLIAQRFRVYPLRRIGSQSWEPISSMLFIGLLRLGMMIFIFGDFIRVLHPEMVLMGIVC
jgi:hypothetical protein